MKQDNPGPAPDKRAVKQGNSRSAPDKRTVKPDGVLDERELKKVAGGRGGGLDGYANNDFYWMEYENRHSG